MSEIAIHTQKLSRRFGNLVAVDSIDLQVVAGQFFGFLGPNGAGKSTTIKMLTGLLSPTSGSMQLLGLDFAAHPVEAKRQIGVVPEGMGLLERLTGSEYLQFVGRMYGLDRATTQRRANELLDFMQLADRPKTLIADYSHGMQKKLALAAAVIHGPRILFLDEPFEGVDALAAGALKALLGRMTWKSSNVSAATWPSFTKAGLWRRARSKNCARAFPVKRVAKARLRKFFSRLLVKTAQSARAWKNFRG